jgi:hypothetical protein
MSFLLAILFLTDTMTSQKPPLRHRRRFFLRHRSRRRLILVVVLGLGRDTTARWVGAIPPAGSLI